MLYETLEEYRQAIKDTQDAIDRVVTSGQSSELPAGSGGTKLVDAPLGELVSHLATLVKEKSSLKNGHKVLFSRSGW